MYDHCDNTVIADHSYMTFSDVVGREYNSAEGAPGRYTLKDTTVTPYCNIGERYL